MLVVVPGVPMFSEKITKGSTLAGWMVRARAALVCPAALVALMVTLEVPEARGVPEIRPVVVFTFKPVGNSDAA